MLGRAARLAQIARDELQCRRDPVGYARRIGVTVGERCFLVAITRRTFSTEPELITIGDDVAIAPEVRFATHDGMAFVFRREFPTIEVVAPVTIRDGAAIGMRAILLPGADVGEGSVVGAGSVVVGKVPPGKLVMGVPARPYMDVQGAWRESVLEKAIFVHDRPLAERRRLFVEFTQGRVDQHGDPITPSGD